MYKLIDTSSFFSSDEPTVQIVDLDATKGFIKQAADSSIKEFVAGLKPDPNKVYLHILAMGAGEYFGANRNADYFPETNLMDYYKTFETSPAHTFRNHINKNPDIALGKVVLAIYNRRMHRVELIAEVDKEKGRDIIERLERGEFPATSMACKTKYDVCSICGNKAHTRQEYCKHLTDDLGRIYPDGRKVMAMNVAPLKFFDISFVVRPADVTSSVLQKVAFELPQGMAVSSAEIAEEEKLTDREKTAEIRKLSEFVKNVSGDIVGASPSVAAALDKVLDGIPDPDMKLIDHLKNYPLSEVVYVLSELGISPSINFLAELIGVQMYGKDFKGVGDVAASLVKKTTAPIDSLTEDIPIVKEASHLLFNVVKTQQFGCSVLPEFVEKRALFGSPDIVRQTNVGFASNGPLLEPTPFELHYAKKMQEGPEASSSIMKTVLQISGIAMLAKWLINKTIQESVKRQNENSRVKIVLVKSASDAVFTSRLLQRDLVKSFTDKGNNK